VGNPNGFPLQFRSGELLTLDCSETAPPQQNISAISLSISIHGQTEKHQPNLNDVTIYQNDELVDKITPRHRPLSITTVL
jgi:hypothetical protein